MAVRRIGFSTLLGGSALAAVAALLMVLPALAAHVEPVFMEGNPRCTGESLPNNPSLGMDDGVKIEADDLVASWDDGSFSVDLVYDVENGSLSFSNASPPVSAVIMKGGPNANVYLYNPAEDADNGLMTPTNPANEKPYGISHVDFCFTEPEPSPSPSPSPTATETPSPTPSPTPTVTETPSPTPSPTVSPTALVSPTPTPSESPTVLGVVLEGDQQLPKTGAESASLAIGLALMAGGALLLAASPGRPATGTVRRD